MLRDALVAEAMLDGEPKAQAPSRQLVPDSGRSLMPRSNAEMGLKPSALERAGFVGADRKLSAIEKLDVLIAADALQALREAAQLRRSERYAQIGAQAFIRSRSVDLTLTTNPTHLLNNLARAERRQIPPSLRGAGGGEQHARAEIRVVWSGGETQVRSRD
jgi:hypothetical protein